MPDRWSLYVDESGTFAGEPSVVAGVLLPHSADAVARSALRRRLARIWAPGPWPPHASTLNIPGSRLLYHVRRGDWEGGQQMGKGGFAAELKAACSAILDGALPEDVARVLQICETGGFPTPERARIVDSWARYTPEYGALRAVAERQGAAMRDLLVDVTGTEPSAHAIIFAAVADQFATDPEPPDDPVEPDASPWHLELLHDAYVRALRGALRRVLMLARPVEIDLLVLTRDVTVGGRKGWPMQSRFIKQVVEEAQVGLPTGATFRVRGVQHRYQDECLPATEVHPGFVLADWVANRMRRVGRGAASWPELQARLVDRGLSADVGGLEQAPHQAQPWAPLPTIACEGEPQEHIDAVLAGQPPRSAAPGDWAEDQAARFALAAAAGVWR